MEVKDCLGVNPPVTPADGDGAERRGTPSGSPRVAMQNPGTVHATVAGRRASQPRRLTRAQDTCKMGADHGRLKGRRRLLSFLEHNGDDVVPDVALPLHLHVGRNNVTGNGPRGKERAERDLPRRSQSPAAAALPSGRPARLPAPSQVRPAVLGSALCRSLLPSLLASVLSRFAFLIVSILTHHPSARHARPQPRGTAPALPTAQPPALEVLSSGAHAGENEALPSLSRLTSPQ